MLCCNRYAVQQSFILGGLGKVNLIVLTAHTQNSSAAFYVSLSPGMLRMVAFKALLVFLVFFNVMYWYQCAVVSGGLDSKIVKWDFSRGRPLHVVDLGG